jgi:DNA-binding response OmpR family regulator
MTKRILIVDNDPDILEVMEEALNYEGFEVFTLKHTDNIFSSLDQFKVDILLIDYILDGINGGELCHQVKSSDNTMQLPVIIMSAYPRVLKSLGYYGCDMFLPKPFDLNELVNNISALINNAHNNIQRIQA